MQLLHSEFLSILKNISMSFLKAHGLWSLFYSVVECYA